MKWYNDLKTGVKISAAFGVVVVLMILVSAFGYIGINSIHDGMNNLYDNNALPIQQLGAESTALYTLRGDLYKSIAIPAQQEEAFTAVQADISELEKQKAQYEATALGTDEQAEAANFSNLWNSYKNAVLAAMDAIKSGDVESVKQSLIDGNLHNTRSDLSTSLSKLI